MAAMTTPRRLAFCLFALVFGSAACGAHMPSTVIPAAQTPSLEDFRAALKTYVDRTQPFRKEAAAKADAVQNQQSPGGSDEAVRLRQRTLAEAIQTKVRPAARPGDVFTRSTADVLRRQLAAAFKGPNAALIRSTLQDQNEGLPAASIALAINQVVATVARVPPTLLDALPQLPQQAEFAFSGRTLILRDVDSDTVVDFMTQALPELQLAGQKPAKSRVALNDGADQLLALPEIPGSTIFAAIGDSGSGDSSQKDVANAMIRYYLNARRFTFVLMLGDNLYDDDYEGEFAVPYKGLLDRGVIFYAALGNHDKDLEQHYKPFHMSDRSYYAFTEGNARFVVLNSNVPADTAQLTWFDSAFGNTGTRWRISFFHHPLYSSGNHATQSREIIRPALEAAMVRNHVDVVFSGHDHLYERIAPQLGVRYFVSGGGGRTLYGFQKSPFDEVGSSEHHFMVMEIAGDQLFYEAVTPKGQTLDCGVLSRAASETAAPPNADTLPWLRACNVATAWRR
jgi:hypothetical protein